ncbi:MAG: hypothetical protein WKH64_11340, partial [Chloroflexia bacterium]
PILDGGRFADVGRALAFQPNGADRNLYLLIATTAAVWAIQLVRSGTDERAPERLFRLGAVPVSVLVFVGLTMWDARTRDFQALTQYVTTFFLLSLGALSLSQWERTRRQSRRGAGAGWATASFLPMLAVIVATLAASALLFGRSAPLLAVVWLLLGGFFAVVVFVAQLVFLPIAEALALLLRPFRGRAQPRPNGVFPTPGPSLPQQPQPRTRARASGRTMCSSRSSCWRWRWCSRSRSGAESAGRWRGAQARAANRHSGIGDEVGRRTEALPGGCTAGGGRSAAGTARRPGATVHRAGADGIPRCQRLYARAGLGNDWRRRASTPTTATRSGCTSWPPSMSRRAIASGPQPSRRPTAHARSATRSRGR